MKHFNSIMDIYGQQYCLSSSYTYSAPKGVFPVIFNNCESTQRFVQHLRVPHDFWLRLAFSLSSSTQSTLSIIVHALISGRIKLYKLPKIDAARFPEYKRSWIHGDGINYRLDPIALLLVSEAEEYKRFNNASEVHLFVGKIDVSNEKLTELLTSIPSFQCSPTITTASRAEMLQQLADGLLRSQIAVSIIRPQGKSAHSIELSIPNIATLKPVSLAPVTTMGPRPSRNDNNLIDNPSFDPRFSELFLDSSSFKKVGDQAGSNPGGFYFDEDTKSRWYIKTPPSEEHVRNEILAAKFYEAANIEVATLRVSILRGTPAIASKIVEHLVPLNQSHPESGAIEGFAVDAWLANWDVVGTTYENLKQKNGKAFRVDAGGSLRFRAQGEPKGAAFGNNVGEIETFRSELNPHSRAIFGKISNTQLAASIDKVLAIPEKVIDDLVDKYGPINESERELLRKKLKLRQKDLALQKDALELTSEINTPKSMEYKQKQHAHKRTTIYTRAGGDCHSHEQLKKFYRAQDKSSVNYQGIPLSYLTEVENAMGMDRHFLQSLYDILESNGADWKTLINEYVKNNKQGINLKEAHLLMGYTTDFWQENLNRLIFSGKTLNKAQRTFINSINSAADKLPSTSGTFLRGLKDVPDWFDEKYSVGNNVFETHFSSVSRKLSDSYPSEIIMEFKASNVKDISELAMDVNFAQVIGYTATASEHLIMANSKFVVTKVKNKTVYLRSIK